VLTNNYYGSQSNNKSTKYGFEYLKKKQTLCIEIEKKHKNISIAHQ